MTTPIDSIRQYCAKYGLRKTVDLLPTKESKSNVELEELFRETETKKVDVMKSLGIVFKGNSERDELRKRIRNMEESHVEKSKPKTKPKKERKEKRQDGEEEEKIPEGFLTLLDELALDRKDAEVLYKNKEQWKFVKSDRKIFCTEQGCKFETTMATDCLAQHCITAHDWRVYPCPYDYCKFEAYSPRSYKTHTASHKQARAGQKCGSIEHVCDRCGKRFPMAALLQTHIKLHDNILCRCHFCPWTGVRFVERVHHLNAHFRIQPYACSFCNAKFYHAGDRTRHVREVHEKIKPVYKCGSCDFETLIKGAYLSHLKLCAARKAL